MEIINSLTSALRLAKFACLSFPPLPSYCCPAKGKCEGETGQGYGRFRTINSHANLWWDEEVLSLSPTYLWTGFLLINIWGLLYQASLVAQTVKWPPALWESRVGSLGQEDPLEKEMATHSSILAWRIPWAEKPGRLQSMGTHRVGHDWANSLSFHFHFRVVFALPSILHWL